MIVINYNRILMQQPDERANGFLPGTPDVTGTVDDDFPSMTTVCVRLVRKAKIQ
jgi:hypothetical protein